MLSLLTADVIEALKPQDNSLKLIITVGNSLRGDDGVGPYIYGKLESRNPKQSQISNLKLLNAGDRPENIIDEVISQKPSSVVIVDSANFGGDAGEARIIPEDRINDSALSTHMFPLGAIAKIIQEDTGAKVLFLGIQQKSIEIGSKMSDEVVKTADEIIEIIIGEKQCATQYPA